MRPAFSVKENSHFLFLCDLCDHCGEKKSKKIHVHVEFRVCDSTK